jgi:predicted O-linked N-acetylglucosamine transferase (SPINDLY family)
VYLPGCYQVNDSNRKISDKSFSRQEFGLPQDQFVFCCFNNNYKILPSTFDSWMRILKSVEGSVLWLFEDNTTASNNLRQHAQLRGVDSNRLIFAKRFPLDEHLARHRLADLFLDTSPYNAHTTASDALWAGLPVVTCMGQSFASRVAASLLKAVGLEELITNTQGEYEAKAIEIALDSLKLSAIKRRLYLKKKESTLFNGKAFAKNLEAAFLKIDERNRLSIEPESMTITPLTLLK